MSDDVADRAEAALSPDARMDAYYYSFRNTGLAVIDSRLSAVATAGKAYHHTEEWGEAGTWDDKPTHESRIQSAADESATLVRELVAELKTARERIAAFEVGQGNAGVLLGRAAEDYDAVVAELKTTRAQLETLRAGLTRVEHFARTQALSERVRTRPAYSTYHGEERYWLDLLALIERAEVADV